MARMLGATPNGRYTTCTCRLCGRTTAEDVIARRNQRARESASWRIDVDAILASLDPEPDDLDDSPWGSANLTPCPDCPH